MDNNMSNQINPEPYGDGYDKPLNQAPKKKGHALRNTIIVILVVVLLLLASLITVVALAFQTPNEDKFDVSPDNGALETILYSALYDEEAYISNDSLNSLIAYFINEDKASRAEENLEESALKSAVFLVSDSEPCKLYSKINVGGHEMEFSAEFSIDSDIQNGEIRLSVSSVHLGALPISPDLALNYIFTNTDAANASFLRRDGNDIFLQAQYSFEIFEQNLTLDIIKLESSDDGVTVKTTSAADLLWNSLGSWFDSLF